MNERRRLACLIGISTALIACGGHGDRSPGSAGGSSPPPPIELVKTAAEKGSEEPAAIYTQRVTIAIVGELAPSQFWLQTGRYDRNQELFELDYAVNPTTLAAFGMIEDGSQAFSGFVVLLRDESAFIRFKGVPVTEWMRLPLAGIESFVGDDVVSAENTSTTPLLDVLKAADNVEFVRKDLSRNFYAVEVGEFHALKFLSLGSFARLVDRIGEERLRSVLNDTFEIELQMVEDRIVEASADLGPMFVKLLEEMDPEASPGELKFYFDWTFRPDDEPIEAPELGDVIGPQEFERRMKQARR